MGQRAGRVIIVTHSDARVAGQALRETLLTCQVNRVEVIAPVTEFSKHGGLLTGAGVTALEADAGLEAIDLCIVLGGDGTMLRAFHMVLGHEIPVAGVNLGRVGFLTTVDRDDVKQGVARLLAGDMREYPLLGLEAHCQGSAFRATNDVVVSKGDQATACSLALRINGITLFEVSCDGVVVGTPAGSSAYSLAAGGPLLGIEVEAYVISLVAPHAVGVRPVVAGPGDILEITINGDRDCYLDVDGQRVRQLPPDSVVRIQTIPSMTSLALLEGDSLYHHFRDRLL